MRFVYGAMIRQRDQVDGDATPPVAQALGKQPGQEGIDLAFEGIEVAELLG
jgi:hypothetical protein